jgi:hypothetical protein
MVSSWTVCIRIISAPHAIQRIARTHPQLIAPPFPTRIVNHVH